MKVLIAVAATALVATLAYLVYARMPTAAAVRYHTLPAERGPISSTVNASGTLEPVKTVQVGSQISGRIVRLHADYNSPVRAGEVIAEIDDATFAAKVAQADAELQIARAQADQRAAALSAAGAELDASRASADAAAAQVREARLTVTDTSRELARLRALRGRGAVSRAELDAATIAEGQAGARLNSAQAREVAERASLASRNARVEMARADVATARAQVARCEAVLREARVDLERTVVRSPVDGVVIDRNVDVGQTVAASLQAPVLFLIAQDLEQMQLEINVDEADVGRVQVGQQATFTVDSFPTQRFAGTVTQIRLAPQTVENVVTYTVVVSADNAERLLLPGMTATTEIVIEALPDALKVPNAALRFRGPGSAGAGGRPGAGSAAPAERVQRLVDGLVEKLGLSHDQRGQLTGFLVEARKVARGEIEGGADRASARAKAWELVRRSIPTILSGSQLEKYRQLVAFRRANPIQPGRVWTVAADGSLQPIAVRIGISDGSFTQVVAGDLAPGTALVTGIDRSAESGERPGTLRIFR